MNTTRIWDLPTRLFHWLLVGAMATAFLTSGESRWLYLHLVVGSLAGGLVVLRLFWGFVGSRYARFADFVRGVSAVRGHVQAILRRQPSHEPGHNPTGGWMILLLLAGVLSIALLGWGALGGLEHSGWLAGGIDVATGATLAELHEILTWGLLGAVGIHVAGVVVESRLLRYNLTLAMLTGRKPIVGVASVDNHTGIAALPLLVAVVSVATALFPWASATEQRPFTPFAGPGLPNNPVWQRECASCHLAFAPSLLPARSWQRMMAEQHDHFGEDLDLDTATARHIEAFLTVNAAERLPTGAAYKLTHRITLDQAPQRITELPYWKHKHSEISDAVWRSQAVRGAINCQACHRDAEAGTFHAGAMHLPPQSLEKTP